MIKTLYALLTLATLTSCVGSYNIDGMSNVPTLDGKMLFLKVYANNELKNVDSCDIVHGQFHFTGSLDSSRVATIFMDDDNLLPVVLESGDIEVKIDNAQQRATGTPLNDKLFGFIEKYTRLVNEVNELGHLQSQAIMNGSDLNVVNAQLNAKAQTIAAKEDKLVTSFIVENFDNVLGPYVFFMATAANEYPELSPWIEDIMSKATDKFKSDPYVKDYYEKAQQNQAIMNGTATPGDIPQNVPDVPTPNEMAQPYGSNDSVAHTR